MEPKSRLEAAENSELDSSSLAATVFGRHDDGCGSVVGAEHTWTSPPSPPPARHPSSVAAAAASARAAAVEVALELQELGAGSAVGSALAEVEPSSPQKQFPPATRRPGQSAAARAAAAARATAVGARRGRGYDKLQEDADATATDCAAVKLAPRENVGAIDLDDEDRCEGHVSTSARSLRAHIAFGMFGIGSGWIVVSAAYMQLPIYQEQFGLAVSNRMAIAYNIGTVSFPFFAFIQYAMRNSRKGLNYPALIHFMILVNMITLIGAAFVDSMEQLFSLSVVGGSYGYLVGLVHQRHIIMNYESVYVAVFWAGDSVAGVLAALLALVQQPELGANGRHFGPMAFYLGLAPCVPLAALAFWYIESTGLGMLHRDSTSCEENAEVAVMPGSGAASAHAVGAGVDIPVGGAQEEAGDPEAGASATRAQAGRGASFRRQLLKLLPSLPEGVRAKSGTTALVLLVVFWANFANWGCGDSIYPFACAQSAGSGVGGDTCVFYASFGTVFAKLFGSSAAAFVKRPSLRWLRVLTACFTFVFILLCLAASWGGSWAHPFEEVAEMHGRSAASGNVGSYIVVLVIVLRTLGMAMTTLATRLVQIVYRPDDWEGLNGLILAVAIVANIAGVTAGTAYLEMSTFPQLRQEATAKSGG